MSWNHRVVRDADDMRIYDIYYDANGAPIAMHAVPTYVYGETLTDLRRQMELMLAALDKPILLASEIGQSPSNKTSANRA